jgi:hypothetical protein
MMKKILVNGTFLVAVALGLVGCGSKKTESQSAAPKAVANVSQNQESKTPRCQFHFNSKNEAVTAVKKIVKQLPQSSMAIYKGQYADGTEESWLLDAHNVSPDQCKSLAGKFNIEYYISSMGEPSFPKKLCYIAMDNCKTAINQADKIFKGKWSQEKSTHCYKGKCKESASFLVKNHQCTIDEKICESIGWNETLVKVYNAEKK